MLIIAPTTATGIVATTAIATPTIAETTGICSNINYKSSTFSDLTTIATPTTTYPVS